ncbi:MAG: efflux RND transporter permease subunit [candidate division WOR-3 bacterium]
MVKLSIRRPIFIIVVFIVILIFGFLSFKNLSLEMLPNIELPQISIITVYPGASSIDVEEQITKKIESAISMVPDVTEINSNSMESVSFVTVSFNWGKNLDAAANDIRTQIELIKSSLPEDAQTPTVFKFSTSMIPVATVAIVFENEGEVAKMYDFTEKVVLDKIRQIPGVGAVSITSSSKKKVNVKVRIPDLIKYNISLSQINSMISANNLNIPLGEIRQGIRSYSIRLPGEYTSVNDISKTIVGYSGKNPVYLYNVADIDFSQGEIEGVAKINGKEGMVVVIQKQSNANTVKIVEELNRRLKDIKNMYPEGTTINIVFDTSKQITNSISNLSSTILYAFIFVVITVFLFLRNITGSLIISLTLPFSLIFGIIYLYLAKSTLNIISLASLSIALGMVVDNSIVVLENIYRHKDEEKKEIKNAALDGTSEVIGAIFASTLTTIAIFIPLLFIEGFTSFLFKQLAYTVSVVLFASLFISITLTPMLSSKLLKYKEKFLEKFHNITEKWFNDFEQFYSNFLSYSMKNKKFIIVTVIIIFVGVLFLLPSIKTEFFSSFGGNRVRGTVNLSPGLRIEITDSIMTEIGKKIKNNFPDVENFVFYAGGTSGRMFGGSTQYSSTIIIAFKDNLSINQVKKNLSSIRKFIQSYPEVKSVEMSSNFAGGFSNQKQIAIEIYGEDISKTFSIAKELKKKIEDDGSFVDVSISREEEIEDISVIPKKENGTIYGVNNYYLMLSLRNGINGNVPSVFRKDGYEYDIDVFFDKKYLRNINNLKSLPITTPANFNVPLSSVASVKLTKQPPTIERKNRMRYISVQANLNNISLSDGNKKVQKMISEISVPQEITVLSSGDVKSQQESFRDLSIAIVIGIILVFLVMAAQFESFLDPFIIFFSIPFAFTGVILALFLTNTTLSIMGFVGMLMLVGIVVNNAIVLVSYMNQLRENGMNLCDAVALAGKRRLRPVLMTTLTTIFGLLPLALSTKEGAEMWRSLGIVVIGGLSFSTIVTLILVPVIYSIVETKIKREKCEI